VEDLRCEADRLVHSSLAKNTAKSYNSGLSTFKQFCLQFKFSHQVPIPPDRIALFVSYLSLKEYSTATIATYLSSISFDQKVQNYTDPTACFPIRKMLEGARIAKSSKDSRLPITADISQKLISALPYVCSDTHETKLFMSAYTLCYFGLMRVSEIIVDSKQPQAWDPNRTLLVSDVISLNTTICKLCLKVTRTNQTGPATLMEIPFIPNCDLCPVAAMNDYLSIRARPHVQHSPLFVHYDSTPLTRYQFTAILKKAVSHASIPQGHLYKSHGFRIGCSSQGATNGLSDEEIKYLGRWSSMSTAFKNYIRIPSSKLLSPKTTKTN
jgi:site-specific recombinase XerD